MRTYASHGTGRGWDIARSPLFAALLIAAGATFGACSDPAGTGGSDAGLDDGGGIPDAYVDNGPLDCGVAPWEGSMCVQGRLYDFATEQPIGVPGEVGIMSLAVTTQGNLPSRDDPAAFISRVAPSGRFATRENMEGDSCLLVLDDFEGYSSASTIVNCYAFGVRGMPEESFRVYVISDDVFASWQATYPSSATAVLGSDWPILLGVCRDSLWQPMVGGQYRYAWDYSSGPSELEVRALSPDRMAVLGPQIDILGDNPPGAATLAVSRLASGETWHSLSLYCGATYPIGGFDWIHISGDQVVEDQTDIFILSGFEYEP